MCFGVPSGRGMCFGVPERRPSGSSLEEVFDLYWLPSDFGRAAPMSARPATVALMGSFRLLRCLDEGRGDGAVVSGTTVGGGGS